MLRSTLSTQVKNPAKTFNQYFNERLADGQPIYAHIVELIILNGGHLQANSIRPALRAVPSKLQAFYTISGFFSGAAMAGYDIYRHFYPYLVEAPAKIQKVYEDTYLRDAAGKWISS